MVSSSSGFPETGEVAKPRESARSIVPASMPPDRRDVVLDPEQDAVVEPFLRLVEHGLDRLLRPLGEAEPIGERSAGDAGAGGTLPFLGDVSPAPAVAFTAH